ncbi:MAG: thiamine phosphate synthase [Chloroherpetonaceae bacterium]|nr:thiamine phosphate synthase [Chloroherpetonaceae bacterium]MDW8020316.1 thiamine phosphate synthase [Chloroherpetonaceae bacterium]
MKAVGGMLPKLLCITDRRVTPKPLAEQIEVLCAAGVQLVQVREKELSDRALYHLATTLRTTTARYGAKLLINDRVDIALAVEADGVVLPELGLPVQVARKIKPEWIIGRSVHTVRGAKEAEDSGVDFIIFGHIFETHSKPLAAPKGLDALREVVESVSVPVFAVGGITPERAKLCWQAGAFGVATISSLMQAQCPQAVMQAFWTAMKTANRQTN